MRVLPLVVVLALAGALGPAECPFDACPASSPPGAAGAPATPEGLGMPAWAGWTLLAAAGTVVAAFLPIARGRARL